MHLILQTKIFFNITLNLLNLTKKMTRLNQQEKGKFLIYIFYTKLLKLFLSVIRLSSFFILFRISLFVLRFFNFSSGACKMLTIFGLKGYETFKIL